MMVDNEIIQFDGVSSVLCECFDIQSVQEWKSIKVDNTIYSCNQTVLDYHQLVSLCLSCFLYCFRFIILFATNSNGEKMFLFAVRKQIGCR